MKSKVYENQLQNTTHFKQKIYQVIKNLDVKLWRRVMVNLIERVHACKRSKDAHLWDIVFHS